MENATPVETPKPEPLSCTECRRRKQKCNREWPCNRCQMRKVPQLCNFSSKPASSTQKDQPRGAKRSNDELTLTPPYTPEDDRVDTNSEIVAWGYMPSATHYNLESAVADDGYTRSTGYKGLPFVEEVNTVLGVVPARHMTDILVQNFLYHVNYFYYSVYPPHFLEDYADWWTKRRNGEQLCPVFTCLLIRTCAYSTQYLDDTTRARIESELGDPVEQITHHFHDAAEKLSKCFGPGKGGLMHVQQLFLSASWWKSESKFTESWHALGAAIREAQEIGLHRDSLARRCSDFEMEMRRRVWSLLFVWDWQISSWLSRPLLIDQKSSKIQTPNLRIDTADNIPSPFTPVKLQYDICMNLLKLTEAERGDFRILLAEIENWMNTFPPVYSFHRPDISRDREFPWIKMQREYLHAMSFMFLLDPLKPCLTKTKRSKAENDFRPKAVDTCLRMLETAKRLFDMMFNDSSRAYIVTCAAFDPACLLTSAVMHDRDKTLPHREKVIDGIHLAMDILSQIGTKAKTGAISFGILSRLVASIPEYAQESPSSKKQKFTSSSQGSSTSPSVKLPSTPAHSTPAQTAYQPEPSFPTVSDFENADFDGLEHIWDWQSLNLNVLGDPSALACFAPLDENEVPASLLTDMSFGSQYAPQF